MGAIDAECLSAVISLLSFSKIEDCWERFDFEVVLGNLVLLGLDNADLDLALHLSSELLPYWGHGLAMAAPVRIEHNHPRVITLHEIVLVIVIIDDNNVIIQAIEINDLIISDLEISVPELNDSILVSISGGEFLRIFVSLLAFWEAEDCWEAFDIEA